VTALLDVADLRHVYGAGERATVAIDGVTFSVAPGELVSIVGPSGCGKTTLLRCVSGLVPATSGSVSLLARAVTGVPEDLALVFQDYSRSLFPWMTVAGNVDFPLRGLHRAERRARVAESLEAVGLAQFADRHPWELSGGMQQRVAIARALAYRPQILLMDEPFASVDAQTRADLEDLVLAVRRRFDMTVLFVTHDIDESVYLADRVMVLSRSPAKVIAVLDVDLPRPRDQIATRQLPAFVSLRAEVARLVRGGAQSPGAPSRSSTSRGSPGSSAEVNTSSRP
jgi:NitT/TauT family transport system ATP-binding protein